MNIIKKIFIFLFLINIITGCKMHKPVEFQKVEKINVSKASFKQITIDAEVTLKNPNFYSVSADSLDLNLNLNKVDFGNVRISNTLDIPANSEKMFKIPFKVSMNAETVSNAIQFINSVSSNTVDIRLKGKIRAKGFLFTKWVNVDVKKTVEIFK